MVRPRSTGGTTASMIPEITASSAGVRVRTCITHCWPNTSSVTSRRLVKYASRSARFVMGLGLSDSGVGIGGTATGVSSTGVTVA